MPNRRTSSKVRGRRKARGTMRSRPQARRRAKASSANRKEFLISKMLSSPHDGARRLELHDVIYNLSGRLRALAYRSGFDLGASLYGHSGTNIGALERALENAGFGKITYQPFESHSIITAYRTRRGAADLGSGMHHFEAGIIAGYMSAHAKRAIYVKESKCVYDGDRFCQFIASPKEELSGGAGNEAVDFEDLVKGVRAGFSAGGAGGASGQYNLLATLPILEEPIFTEAEKLTYELGTRLAENSDREAFRDNAEKLGRYLGIEKVAVRKKGKATEVLLTFGHGSSVRNFVSLNSAVMEGFAKGVLNKNVYVQRRLNGQHGYSVIIRLLPRSNARRKKA
ncbi:V4R domain protein [uncultured archaeon]|nr:V4R domain protein [uncultured archaeon]